MDKEQNEDCVREVILHMLSELHMEPDMEKDDIFRFQNNMGGSLRRLTCYICMRRDMLLSYAMFPCRGNAADGDMMQSLSNALNRMNADLSIGNLEIDYRDGKILAKVAIDCAEWIPGDAIIRDMLLRPGEILKANAATLMNIIFCRCNAEEN